MTSPDAREPGGSGAPVSRDNVASIDWASIRVATEAAADAVTRRMQEFAASPAVWQFGIFFLKVHGRMNGVAIKDTPSDKSTDLAVLKRRRRYLERRIYG